MLISSSQVATCLRGYNEQEKHAFPPGGYSLTLNVREGFVRRSPRPIQEGRNRMSTIDNEATPLELYGHNLTRLAQQGAFAPLAGQDAVAQRVCQVLGRLSPRA